MEGPPLLGCDAKTYLNQCKVDFSVQNGKRGGLVIVDGEQGERIVMHAYPSKCSHEADLDKQNRSNICGSLGDYETNNQFDEEAGSTTHGA